jgi:glycosyltransferase involved in cell wall biosynthesis
VRVVSVITVVLNGERVLGRTLESIAVQRGCKIEHILIDGGSRDRTLGVLKSYSSLESRVISEPDRGPYDAMNKGLALASGEIITFLNAGDCYRSEDSVRHAVDAFESGKVDMVLGGVSIHSPGDSARVRRVYKVDSWVPEKLLRGLAPPHPGAFYSRNILDLVGNFDASYLIAGDFELFLRIFLKHRGRGVTLDELLVDMPTGGLSMQGMRSILRNTLEIRRALLANGFPASWSQLLLRMPSKWLEGRPN